MLWLLYYKRRILSTRYSTIIKSNKSFVSERVCIMSFLQQKVAQRGKHRIVVVLPAYNCAKTLEQTINDIPPNCIDEIVLVDDASTDETLKVAESLNIKHIKRHNKNLGYGANQKSCYDIALSIGADIVVMLHPDYQYDPSLIVDIVNEFSDDVDIVLASRMIKGYVAVKLGMPLYKFCANKVLTWFQNLMLDKHLSEYHTGYRAYKADILRQIDYHALSDDFIVDNQILLAAFRQDAHIHEIYCPAKYMPESSSIGLMRSICYGFGVVYHTLRWKLCTTT